MRVPMSSTNLLNDRFLTLLAHGGDTLIGQQSVILRRGMQWRGEASANGKGKWFKCGSSGRCDADRRGFNC
jgi:hypothetical protein